VPLIAGRWSLPGKVARRGPSAFQAGQIPSWRGSCECYALSPSAAVSHCSLLLLSPLLSAQLGSSGDKLTPDGKATRSEDRKRRGRATHYEGVLVRCSWVQSLR
jgi:hypothetical protein